MDCASIYLEGWNTPKKKTSEKKTVVYAPVYRYIAQPCSPCHATGSGLGAANSAASEPNT